MGTEFWSEFLEGIEKLGDLKANKRFGLKNNM
jgi:hypothetical protein